MAHQSPAAPLDVGCLLDEGKWGGYQKRLIVFTALAIVFDGIDNQLLGVAIPSIMQEWSAPRSVFAPVVTIGLTGMMLGGALAGLAGDRFGRRTALLASMGLFGLMTAVSAAAATPAHLTVLRFLASAGLGGAIPNATALAAEYVPARHRPVAVTLTIVCVPLGVIKAVRHGSRFDFVSSFIVFLGYSVPGWALGTALLVLLGGGSFWSVFPLGGFRPENWSRATR